METQTPLIDMRSLVPPLKALKFLLASAVGWELGTPQGDSARLVYVVNTSLQYSSC